MFEDAKKTLNHYMEQNYTQRGWKWDSDNRAEIDGIFEDIEIEIKREVREEVKRLMAEKYHEIGEEMLEITHDMKQLAKELKRVQKHQKKSGIIIDKPFYKKNLDGEV